MMRRFCVLALLLSLLPVADGGKAEAELYDARSVIAFFSQREAALEFEGRLFAARRWLYRRTFDFDGLTAVKTVAPNATSDNLAYALNKLAAVSGSRGNASKGLYDGNRTTLHKYFKHAKKQGESSHQTQRRLSKNRQQRGRRRSQSALFTTSRKRGVDWGSGGPASLARLLGLVATPLRLSHEILRFGLFRAPAWITAQLGLTKASRVLRFGDRVLKKGPTPPDLLLQMWPFKWHTNHFWRRTATFRRVGTVAWRSPREALRWAKIRAVASYFAIFGYHERLEAALLRAAAKQAQTFLVELKSRRRVKKRRWTHRDPKHSGSDET